MTQIFKTLFALSMTLAIVSVLNVLSAKTSEYSTPGAVLSMEGEGSVMRGVVETFARKDVSSDLMLRKTALIGSDDLAEYTEVVDDSLGLESGRLMELIKPGFGEEVNIKASQVTLHETLVKLRLVA